MIELATRYEKEYPLASRATLLERYMDDFFSGTDSIQELKKLYKELCVMMNHGGFELSKWRSNCEELLQFIRQDIAEIDPVMDLSDEYTAVLGLKWESRADSFLFCMETEWSEEVKVTKRVVASEVAKLYDPNGYLAPVVVTAKCFIQKLWQQKMEWDDELSSELREEWKDFFIQLEALNNIRIPRWLLTSGGRAFELIGFADASQKAYGAVIYVRVYDGEKYHCNLLTSRSRVAPVKTISIPRLELCAAETLATLMEQVHRDCHIEYANYHCFTDSMITLNWLRNESAMFKTFVSNRVASVQRSTDVKCWRHVSTKSNPADMLSRGLRAKELPENELWWQGPSFLRQSHQYWPHTEGDLVEEQLVEIQGEFRPKVCARATFKSLDWLQINGLCLIERYSSLNKLVRITACVLSWFRHRATKSEPKSIGYSNELLNEALEYWIRFTQRKVFTSEINLIKEGKALCKSSALFRLNPFLDERSILRLRGRLDNANVSYDEQHPIIIPAHTRFVRLLMQEAHEKTQHGHIQIMLHYIRAKYWVIQSRRAALREIKSCVVCIRHAHHDHAQLMGSLPKERLTIAPAFTYCGVDHFGPISLQKWEGRCNTTIAGYVAIFVCMTTKIVHMECCTDLTAERFIWALSRMSAIYRAPVKMFSDNGRTFVGANNELKRISQSWDSEEVRNYLSINHIQWVFITPRAPFQGGLWEAAVKSAKYHLKRIIGTQRLTFERYQTILMRVSGTLNSRPLTRVTDEPMDLNYLTPAGIHHGGRAVQPLTRDMSDRSLKQLQYNKRMELMHQDFWNGFRKDYLSSLQTRYKWNSIEENLKVGDLVIIKEDGLPPNVWCVGRIIEVYPGADNLVRSVKLKTATTELVRPVRKLVRLPIQDQGPIAPTTFHFSLCNFAK